MEFSNYSFGQITIDGIMYNEDVVLNKGHIELRDKTASEPFKAEYGHTPLTLAENIPWECQSLIIGIGDSGALPITEEIHKKAGELGVKILAIRTPDAIKILNSANLEDTNAIIHLTC